MNTALTAEEKCRLRKWIADGNDPADNPWLMSGEDTISSVATNTGQKLLEGGRRDGTKDSAGSQHGR